MRIAIVGSGRSIHVLRWVRFFADRGHEVHLVSEPCDPVPGVTVHGFPFDDAFYVPRPWLLVRMRGLLRDIDPDVVHAHYATAYGAHAVLSGHRPVLVAAWGTDALVTPEEGPHHALIARLTLRLATGVTTTSRYMADHVHRRFGVPRGRIHQSYWGLDLDKVDREVHHDTVARVLARAGGRVVVTSPRNAVPAANVHHLVEALPNLDRLHDVHVVIVRGYGDASYVEMLRRRVTELGLTERVDIIDDRLSHEGMLALLGGSQIVASLFDTDQFASTLVETMYLGAIPVVSDLPVYLEHLEPGRTAFFVDPRDPDAVARGLREALDALPRRADIAAENRRVVEEREDWRKNAPRMESLYERVARRR